MALLSDSIPIPFHISEQFTLLRWMLDRTEHTFDKKHLAGIKYQADLVSNLINSILEAQQCLNAQSDNP